MLGATTFSLQLVLMQLMLLPMVAGGISGLVRWRQLPRGLRYLLGLIGFALATEVAARLLWQHRQPNLFLVPLYSAGEFWLLTLVYRQALRSTTFTRTMPWLAGGFAAYCVVDSVLSPELARFKPSLQIVEQVLVLGLAVLYFRKLLNDLLVRRLTSEPMFWVSAGLVVYCLGNMQISLFSNYLLNYSKQLSTLR